VHWHATLLKEQPCQALSESDADLHHWCCVSLPQGLTTPFLEPLQVSCRAEVKRLFIFACNVLHYMREKHYISSNHLGLIRCLNPIRVSAIMYTQTFFDKLGYPMQINLHDLDHCTSMLSKEPRIVPTDILQALVLNDKMEFIPGVINMANRAKPSERRQTASQKQLPSATKAITLLSTSARAPRTLR